MERLSHVDLGLSQETERPKGKAKLSKPLEKMYLVLPFSFNSFKFEAETNLFASLLTSHFEQYLDQEHSSSYLDDRQGPPRSSAISSLRLKSSHAERDFE